MWKGSEAVKKQKMRRKFKHLNQILTIWRILFYRGKAEFYFQAETEITTNLLNKPHELYLTANRILICTCKNVLPLVNMDIVMDIVLPGDCRPLIEYWFSRGISWA